MDNKVHVTPHGKTKKFPLFFIERKYSKVKQFVIKISLCYNKINKDLFLRELKTSNYYDTNTWQVKVGVFIFFKSKKEKYLKW